MSIYYQSGNVTIYHGNALEIMPDLKADMIFADPPYNQTALEWDKWPADWPDTALSSVLPHGSMWCFGTLRMFMRYRDQFSRWHMAQDTIWEKHNGSGAKADRFNRVHEQLVHFYPNGRKWEEVYKFVQVTMDAKKRSVRRKMQPAHYGKMNPSSYETRPGGPRLKRSVMHVRSMHGRALNETHKPTGIISPHILYSCRPGGTVLDPFMGSGEITLTARNLGFSAIGIDIREDQCEIAAKQLEQLSLFQSEEHKTR